MLLLLETLDERNKYAVLKRDLLVIPPSTEPVCLTIGRKVECDLSFPLDKSISRKHCNLFIYPNGAITVTDLKSSFGTHINGIKCPPNEESKLDDKIHFKFGNEFTNVRISKYKFCNTRLDKTEKDRLKEICRSVGGEMVKHLEPSSHLLCNRYSATVKILQALVLQKPIVSFGFVEALIQILSSPEVASADNKKKVTLVSPPAESHFKPMESMSISNISNPADPRENLLIEHTVILLEASDEQYLSILTNCGAHVLNLLALPTHTTAAHLLQEVQRQQQQLGGGTAARTCSIFFEDSKSPSAKTILLSRSTQYPFFNTGALAMSIFENLPPKLLPADTLSQRALSQQQSHSQQQLSSQLDFDTSTTTSPLDDTGRRDAPRSSVVASATGRNSFPPTIKEEPEEGNGDGTGVKASVASASAGAVGLARVTTLIPTQDVDRVDRTPSSATSTSTNTSIGRKISAVQKKTQAPSIEEQSKAVSESIQVSPVPSRRRSKNNTPTVPKLDYLDSPVQMCDINIKVDLSGAEEEEHVSVGAETTNKGKASTSSSSSSSKSAPTLVKKAHAKTETSPSREPEPDPDPDTNTGTQAQAPAQMQEVVSVTSPAVLTTREAASNQKKKKRKAPEEEEVAEQKEEKGDFNRRLRGREGGNGDDEVEFSAPPPRSRRKKQLVPAAEVSAGFSLEQAISMGDAHASMSAGCNNNDEEEEEDGEDECDGWCLSSRSRKKQKQSQQQKASLQEQQEQLAEERRRREYETSSSGVGDGEEKEKEDDLVYPQAVSVEVHLALRATSTSSSAAAGTSGVPKGGRGTKIFHKNYVRGHFHETVSGSDIAKGRCHKITSRRPQLIISLRDMDKLLPKESEREHQLQREYEEEQRKLVEKDELFSDRTEKVKGKGRRKLFG